MVVVFRKKIIEKLLKIFLNMKKLLEML